MGDKFSSLMFDYMLELKPSPWTRHHNKMGDKFNTPMFDYMLELVSLLVRSSDLRSEGYGVRQSSSSLLLSSLELSDKKVYGPYIRVRPSRISGDNVTIFFVY